MAAYDLGTARGVISIGYDPSGILAARKSLAGLDQGMQNSGSRSDRIAKGMAIAGGVIAGGLAIAVKSAADFEQEISAIGAVSGANAGQLDQVRAKALQLGKDTKFSASEAAQAMEELAKAGIPLPDIMNGAADATVALAAAGGVSLPEAATISANAMNQFGLKARDMNGVVNAIAGAANASAIDVSEFGFSLQQVGAVAHLAGMSFKDTSVAIAEMGNAGIKGSDAGTSLKTFLQNLIPQTSKQIALFHQLGLSSFDAGNAMQFLSSHGVKPTGTSMVGLMSQLRLYVAAQNGVKPKSAAATQALQSLMTSAGIMSNKFFDATGKTKGLAQIQGVLAQAMHGMSKEQQLVTLQTLFGSDAIRAAAVLAQNGAAGYTKMASAMDKVSAADVARTRMNNFKGSLEQLKGSVETASISIGEILLPALRKIVDGVNGVLGGFLTLSPVFKVFITYGALIAGSLLLAGAAMIKFVKFAKELSAAMRFIMALKGVQAVMINFRIAMGIATSSVRAFTLSLLTNPVFLIIAAIVALVAVLVLLFLRNKTFHDFVMTAWNDIKNVVLAAVRAVVAAALAFASAMVTTFNVIRSALVTAWNATWNAIAGVVRAVWGVITSVIITQINIVRAVITAVVGAIAATWQALWRTFGPVVTAVWGLIVAIVQLAVALIGLVIRTFLFGVSALWNAIWSSVRSVALSVWNAIRAAAVAVWGAIRAFLSFEWNGIKAMASAVFNAMRGAIIAAWNAIRGPVTAVVNTIRSVVSSGFNAVRSVVSSVMNAVRAVVGSVWNSVAGIVRGAVSAVLSAIRPLASIASTIGGYFGRVLGAVTSRMSGVIGYIGRIPGMILGAIGNLGGLLFDVGRSIIQGLLNGVESMISAVTSKLHGLTSLIKSVKGPPEVDRVLLTPAGQSIMESLIAGFEQKIPAVQAVLKNLTYNVIPTAVTSAGMGGAPVTNSKMVNVHVTNNNPVAETGSDTVARNMRTLAAMGVI